MSNPDFAPHEPTNETQADELRDRINGVAEALYQRIAARFETDAATIHRNPYCGYVEPLFRDALAAAGIECTEHIVRFQGGGIHRFERTTDGRLWDGTWQQFLPPDKLAPGLPKVLGGRPEEIQEYLQQLGVEEQIGAIWSGQEEVQLPQNDDEGWGWMGSEPRTQDLTAPDVVVDDEIIAAIKRIQDTL